MIWGSKDHMGVEGSNNEPQGRNELASQKADGSVRVAVEAKPGLSAGTGRAGGTRRARRRGRLSVDFHLKLSPEAAFRSTLFFPLAATRRRFKAFHILRADASLVPLYLGLVIQDRVRSEL